MYDCSGPTLVFVTQTHNPVTEQHTGYIFALFDVHFHKPRELFFSHIAEAHIFALRLDAVLHMDEEAAPGVVTALDYAVNGEDESRFIHMPNFSGTNPNSNWRAKRKAELELTEKEVEIASDESLVTEPTVADIDYFGGDA